MKKIILAAVAALMILTLTSCGSGGNASPVFVTSILSDPFYDGDIQDATIVSHSNVTQNVFAGITNSNSEYRAFLDFHLTGVNGVPGNAIIDSAFLDIVINSIVPQPLTVNGTVPLLIDLVSFQPPNLVGSDFDRTLQPALLSITVNPTINFNGQVTIDVTPLMIEAQRLVLPDFQIRIVGIVAPGLIEINDTTGLNRSTLAPLLQVTYF